MGQRRRISRGDARVQLRRLMVMFDASCWWCRGRVRNINWPPRQGVPPPDKATRDHVHVFSKGGREDLDNLVLACWACNQERGPLAEQKWRRKLRLAGREPPTRSDFSKLRRTWSELRPEWFPAYISRIEERRSSARPGSMPPPAGSDHGSGPATESVSA